MEQNILEILTSVAKPSSTQDDLSNLGTASNYRDVDGLKEAMKNREKDRQARVNERFAIIIEDLTGHSEKEIDKLVAELRAIRHTGKVLEKRIKAITRASAYGKETLNFVPLLYLVGGKMLSLQENALFCLVGEEVASVPEDWEPKQ